MRKLFRRAKLVAKHGLRSLYDPRDLLQQQFALTDFNVLLHNLRTLAIQQIPAGASSFLSAGCSGNWYFDWIEENYGAVEKHIGIEYYSPRPNDLPKNVDWIQNTVSDMSDVASESVDVFFSGQNVEHLWPDELVGSLLETYRTLKNEGVAVIDSPNRAITSLAGWNHPEHIMELTVEEIRELLSLSGFDQVRVKGLWLCMDPADGTLLPLNHSSGMSPWSVIRRITAGFENPEQSFIWWAEGVKGKRQPDAAKLRKRVDEIYSEAWNNRIQRMKIKCPTEPAGQTGIPVASTNRRQQMLRGPHMPLRAGRHAFEFKLSCKDAVPARPEATHVATCEVYVPRLKQVVAKKRVMLDELTSEMTPLRLEFALDQLEFGVQYRVSATGRASVQALAQVSHLEGAEQELSHKSAA